jgi:hypothetical protein
VTPLTVTLIASVTPPQRRGMALGLGWLAAEITATTPYADLILPFLIAGAGLGFFFAPITRLTLSYAPEQLEGIASGSSYALRQLGTCWASRCSARSSPPPAAWAARASSAPA